MKSKTSIGVEVHIDAAHLLPDHQGKCANLHGHTWHITVEVTKKHQPRPKDNMVVDLSDLKKMINDCIFALDHNHINKFLQYPTCENLVEWLYKRITIHSTLKDNSLVIAMIKIREGEGGYAKWIR